MSTLMTIAMIAPVPKPESDPPPDELLLDELVALATLLADECVVELSALWEGVRTGFVRKSNGRQT